MLLGEGSSGVAKLRVPAWEQARGVIAGDLHIIENMPQAGDHREAAEVIEELKARGIQPALIVSDTLSRAMVGLNESDPGDMSQYLRMADGLSKVFDSAFLTICHSGKNDALGVRGSTALSAGVDGLWFADPDRDDLTVTLTAKKLKDAEAPEPYFFRGQGVSFTDPEVIEYAEGRDGLVFSLDKEGGGKAAGTRGGISPGDVGRALKELGAIAGEADSVTTNVLATKIAEHTGHNDDRGVINAKGRALNRIVRKRDRRFSSYISHESTGQGDGSMWLYPRVTEGPEAGLGH